MTWEINRWKPNALSELKPNALWTLDGDTLIWHDTEQTAPSDADLLAKCTQMNVDYKLGELRTERTKRLVETDYWVLGDTATASQAQLDYRQALRNITDTYTSLDDVVWPTKPE